MFSALSKTYFGICTDCNMSSANASNYDQLKILLLGKPVFKRPREGNLFKQYGKGENADNPRFLLFSQCFPLK